MAKADLNHSNFLRWILVYMRGVNGGATTKRVLSHQNHCLAVFPCSAKEHLFLEFNPIPEHIVAGPGKLTCYGLDCHHPVSFRSLPLVVAGILGDCLSERYAASTNAQARYRFPFFALPLPLLFPLDNLPVGTHRQ